MFVAVQGSNKSDNKNGFLDNVLFQVYIFITKRCLDILFVKPKKKVFKRYLVFLDFILKTS